ncbi:hypothetical protein ACFQV8_31755 [Pseudonocardia benzenivorans]
MSEVGQPVLVARGVTLATRHGRVFEGIDVSLPRGGLLSVHGPAGSGRTMLLLALCGRARVSSGELAVAGRTDGPGLRRRAALAPTGGAVALEPELTVGAHERERLLLGPARAPSTTPPRWSASRSTAPPTWPTCPASRRYCWPSPSPRSASRTWSRPTTSTTGWAPTTSSASAQRCGPSPTPGRPSSRRATIRCRTPPPPWPWARTGSSGAAPSPPAAAATKP